MSHLDRPKPQPGVDDAGFWEAIAQRRLHFQRCSDCARYNHPPLPVCPHCQGRNLDWQAPTEVPKLFSFTVTHVAPDPAFASSLPITVAVVRYPQANIQFVSNFCGEANADTIDRDVELIWSDEEGSDPLPIFKIRECMPDRGAVD